MIYLIDDNQNNQRLKNYNCTFIEEGIFDGYLTAIEKLADGKNNSDVSHLEFLKSADCILLHATAEDYDLKKGFLSGSNTNVMKIKEIISQEGEIVPLVLFSNRMGEAEFDFEKNPKFISSIKKNLLYERLFDFIEHYKNSGYIELRIIAWGKNFAFREITKHAIEILNALSLKDNQEYLLLTDMSNVINSLKSFFKLSLPGTNINFVLNKIEDEHMSVQTFKRKINLITESYAKYGKNIHTWE